MRRASRHRGCSIARDATGCLPASTSGSSTISRAIRIALQAEQFKLTRIIHTKLSGDPNYQIEFDRRVCGVSQDASGVTVQLQSADGAVAERRGSWLIGADGARSEVRGALAMEFEGFTWPERFLVVSTPFDFYSVIPELDPVTYVADPQQWHFLLQIPGAWRLMFPVAPKVSDEDALTAAVRAGPIGDRRSRPQQL